MPRKKDPKVLLLKPKIRLDYITAEKEYAVRELAAKYRKLGFSISKTTIHEWIKKEKWNEERQRVQDTLVKKVTNKVIEAKSRAKAKMIRDAESLSQGVYDLLSKKLEDAKNEKGDIEISIKDFVALQKLVGELRGILSKSNNVSNKQVIFNINVPIEYLTAEGRDWLRKKMQNPIEDGNTITLSENEYEVTNTNQEEQQ